MTYTSPAFVIQANGGAARRMRVADRTAQGFGVAPSDCAAENGTIRSRVDGRRVGHGEITFESGRVVQSNFDICRVLPIDTATEVELNTRRPWSCRQRIPAGFRTVSGDED